MAVASRVSARRVALRSCVLVGLLLCSYAGGQAEEGGALPEVGSQAPGFTLPLYNAKVASGLEGASRLSLASLLERPGTRLVVVGFMASHCGPCWKELPVLQSLQQRHGAAGLQIVWVAIDAEPEGQRKVEARVTEKKVSFPVLKDRFQLVVRRWLGPTSPLPSLFLVTPDGRIAGVRRGYAEGSERDLERELQRFLVGPDAGVVRVK